MQLQEELAERNRRFAELEKAMAIEQFDAGRHSDLSTKVVSLVGEIVELSRRIFPGPISINYSFDPENPADEYLVFDVVAQGDYKDYRESEFQWHEEVEKIVPGTLGEFRLSVMPQR